MSQPLFETFSALEAVGFCRHAFIDRIPGIDVKADRAVVLGRLEAAHSAIREGLGLPAPVTAEQVHGNAVALVDERTTGPVPGVDGLVTNRPDVCLGIHVADCCAVYLVDLRKRCIGLVHSGKKGTELGIVPAAVGAMGRHFGSEPGDLLVQISPCIRPPFYEVDIAAAIKEQCAGIGVGAVHDCDTCTAADLGRYYSYRAELGKTGRMLALLGLHGVILRG